MKAGAARLALVAAIIAAAPSAGADPADQRFQRELHGIKGPEDQRVRQSATQFPWSAMGRLNNGQGGHCSATLIGPRLVATAAHCLWNNRTQRPMPAQAFTFVAGFDRGEYLRAAKITAMHTAPGWNFDTERPTLASRADDWALLELDTPVGDDIGWIATAEPRVGQVVAVAGYGKDKAFVPLAHIGCHLTEQVLAGVFFHDCDAVQGESGGPVLIWRDGQVRLVAVNVAVIPSRGEMGVAAGIGPLAALAARLGGAASATRAGPLSQAGDSGLGRALGR